MRKTPRDLVRDEILALKAYHVQPARDMVKLDAMENPYRLPRELAARMGEALAGVAVHIAAHAVAKALGFYAATPLLGHEPSAGEEAVTGIGRSQPALGLTMGLSLGALSGLPPSPLFVSEVLIVAGGFQAGRPWAAAATALLLALGFLGLAHALLETVAGKARRRAGLVPGLRGVTVLAGIAVVLLLGFAAAGIWLPGTEIVDALMEGAS